MTHLMDFTRTLRMTVVRWKGTAVVLGKNQAMKMLLGVE